MRQNPIQTVASAGRKQQGRRTVKLTRSQVAIATKLGVPLEEYAKYVKGVNMTEKIDRTSRSSRERNRKSK